MQPIDTTGMISLMKNAGYIGEMRSDTDITDGVAITKNVFIPGMRVVNTVCDVPVVHLLRGKDSRALQILEDVKKLGSEFRLSDNSARYATNLTKMLRLLYVDMFQEYVFGNDKVIESNDSSSSSSSHPPVAVTVRLWHHVSVDKPSSIGNMISVLTRNLMELDRYMTVDSCNRDYRIEMIITVKPMNRTFSMQDTMCSPNWLLIGMYDMMLQFMDSDVKCKYVSTKELIFGTKTHNEYIMNYVTAFEKKHNEDAKIFLVVLKQMQRLPCTTRVQQLFEDMIEEFANHQDLVEFYKEIRLRSYVAGCPCVHCALHFADSAKCGNCGDSDSNADFDMNANDDIGNEDCDNAECNECGHLNYVFLTILDMCNITSTNPENMLVEYTIDQYGEDSEFTNWLIQSLKLSAS